MMKTDVPQKMVILLLVAFLAADFACYEIYGRGFGFRNLLTVHANFNFSVTPSDATDARSAPRGVKSVLREMCINLSMCGNLSL